MSDLYTYFDPAPPDVACLGVDLNGLIIDEVTPDDDGIVWVAMALDGWFDTPDSTLALSDFAQGGEFVSVARLNGRAVAAQFLARNAVNGEPLGAYCFLAMERMKRAINATFVSVLMKVTDPMFALQSRVRLAQPMRSRILGELGAVQFSVPILCPDPRRYDQTPQIVPLTAGSNVVTNYGDLPTPVVITCSGPATSPTFQNTTAAEAPTLGYTGSVPSGQDLVIGTAAESVTVNGVNQRSNLTLNRWWNLVPGANTLVVSDDCAVRFSDAYL